MTPSENPAPHFELAGGDLALDFANTVSDYLAPTRREKLTSYDAEKSGVGFMLVNQDAKLFPQFWDLVKAMGARGVNLQSSTGTMMERIASGENLIGYNILGSYAITRAKKDPSIGVQISPVLWRSTTPREWLRVPGWVCDR